VASLFGMVSLLHYPRLARFLFPPLLFPLRDPTAGTALAAAVGVLTSGASTITTCRGCRIVPSPISSLDVVALCKNGNRGPKLASCLRLTGPSDGTKNFQLESAGIQSGTNSLSMIRRALAKVDFLRDSNLMNPTLTNVSGGGTTSSPGVAVDEGVAAAALSDDAYAVMGATTRVPTFLTNVQYNSPSSEEHSIRVAVADGATAAMARFRFLRVDDCRSSCERGRCFGLSNEEEEDLFSGKKGKP
jgi:hypothetical protein